MQPNVGRRTFMGLAMGAVAALTVGRGARADEHTAATAPAVHGAHTSTKMISADEALQRLLDGNLRFQHDETTLAHHQTSAWRKGLLHAQHPFATVLGCCDSRVPPEILFDQGVGDLFVIRVAGNIVDAEMIGSLEYAFEHLQTPLFLVLGHEECGAVKAAIDEKLTGGHDLKEIDGLLSMIGPSLAGIDLHAPIDQVWQQAIEANVRQSMKQLGDAGPVRDALKDGRFKLLGGIYQLGTGKIRLLS